MEQFPVNVFGTHANPHWDELIAFIMLRMRGNTQFPGITNAEIKIFDEANDLKFSAQDYLQNLKILLVGIGKGTLDEHGPNNQGKCCADLTAELLGISNSKKMFLLLKSVRRADRDAITTPLDFSQCVNLLNRYANLTPKQVEEWLFQFFMNYLDEKVTLIPQEDQAGTIVFPVKNEGYRNLQTLYQRWLKEKGITQPSQLQSIKILTKYIDTLSKRPASKLFDLAEAVALINACNPDDQKVAYQWVSVIFEAKLAEQTEFDQAMETVKKTPIKRIETDDGSVRIMEISKSNNRCLLKATRNLEKPPDILIVQNLKKNVLIFNLRGNGSFPWIVAAIRVVEQLLRWVRTVDLITDFDELSQPETIKNLDNWYYFVTDRGVKFGLFNGSLTRPKLSPTLIPFDQLHLIIREALDMSNDSHRWEKWVNEQITLRRQSVKQRQSLSKK